jgi:hypothetical protein
MLRLLLTIGHSFITPRSHVHGATVLTNEQITQAADTNAPRTVDMPARDSRLDAHAATGFG